MLKAGTIIYFDSVGGFTRRVTPRLSNAMRSHRLVFLMPQAVSQKMAEREVQIWINQLGHNCVVNACWSRYNYPYHILKNLLSHKSRTLYFNLEFTLFGNIASIALCIPLFLFLKVLRVKVILTLHFVVPRKKSVYRQLALSRFRHFMSKGSDAQEVGFSLVPLFYRLLGTFCSKIAVFSKFQAQELSLYGVSSSKIVSISYFPFLYASSLAMSDSLARWTDRIGSRSDSLKTILYVGMLGDDRGLEELVLANRILIEKGHRVRFLIGGSPSTYGGREFTSRLKRLISDEKIGDSVIFLGWLTDLDMYSVCSFSDVFAIPYRFAESGSSKLAFLGLYYSHVRLVSTASPVLSEQIQDLGLKATYVPLNFSVNDLVNALEASLGQKARAVSDPINHSNSIIEERFSQFVSLLSSKD